MFFRTTNILVGTTLIGILLSYWSKWYNFPIWILVLIHLPTPKKSLMKRFPPWKYTFLHYRPIFRAFLKSRPRWKNFKIQWKSWTKCLENGWLRRMCRLIWTITKPRLHSHNLATFLPFSKTPTATLHGICTMGPGFQNLTCINLMVMNW